MWDTTINGRVLVGEDVTDGDGAYAIAGIESGTVPNPNKVMVKFSDPTGAYATEYWDDAIVDRPHAKWVTVPDGGVTPDIDASLEPGGSISGRLTNAKGEPVELGAVSLFWQVAPNSYHRVADYVTGDDVTDIDAVLGGVVKNTAAPAVTGTPQGGSTLTATSGWAPTDTSVAYRWVVGDDTTPADDPTGATHVPTTADLGKTIKVVATGTRGAGWTPATATSAASAPVAAAPVPPVAPTPVLASERAPKVKGKLKVGKTIRVTQGTWTPYPKDLTYTWYAGGKVIKGAKRQWFTLTKKQVGKRITVVVTASAPGYDSLAVTTKRTDKVKR